METCDISQRHANFILFLHYVLLEIYISNIS